jgi:hypothetical protein
MSAASRNILESDGTFPIPFEIDNKEFVYRTHVLSITWESISSKNLDLPMILQMDDNQPSMP